MFCFKGHERELEALRREITALKLEHAVDQVKLHNRDTHLAMADQRVRELNEENRSLLERVFFLANANPPEPKKAEPPSPEPKPEPEVVRPSEAGRRMWLTKAQEESARLDEQYEKQVTLAVIKETEYAST